MDAKLAGIAAVSTAPAVADDAALPTRDQVHGLKHFKRLVPLFARLHDVGCARDRAGNRELHFDGYCALVTLYLINPLIGSMRALRHVLTLPGVAAKIGVKRFSLGSFSEAPAAFEPQRLLAIIEELGAEARPLARDPRLADLKRALTLVDGTVLRGIVRLAQAATTATVTAGKSARKSAGQSVARKPPGINKAVHGWRLHTQLELDAIAPLRVDVTRGANGGDDHEPRVLRRTLAPGRCYVADAGYADRALFDDVVAADSSYVCRVRETAVFQVTEERLLSDEALAAGVVRDAVVTLGAAGSAAMNHAVRVVEVQITPHVRRTRAGQGGKTQRVSDRLLIATDLLDLPPELIALIYRYRYAVELFFRMFKHLLGMRHLLSQRRNGVEIQTYLAVIACLVIGLQTGRKPDRRTVETLGWYLLGLATEQDVIDHLNKPDNRGVKLRAKEALWKKLGY